MTARERVLTCCREMERAGGPVPVADLAALAHCTPRQVQRDFRAIGITPAAYGKAVRTEAAKSSLRSRPTVSEAIYDAGYGSVRAFYEEAGKRLGMTPSEYATGKTRQTLIWATTPSAVGVIIAVASPRGLCAVRIDSDRNRLIDEIQGEFGSSDLIEGEVAMRDVLRALRALALGGRSPDLPLDVQGTAFQARVWQALRLIPRGQTRTYTDVAESIGSPSSVRAVASACAHNPVALTVPCHRVIRRDGSLAGYAWGLEVKEQLLTAEQSAADI